MIKLSHILIHSFYQLKHKICFITKRRFNQLDKIIFKIWFSWFSVDCLKCVKKLSVSQLASNVSLSPNRHQTMLWHYKAKKWHYKVENERVNFESCKITVQWFLQWKTAPSVVAWWSLGRVQSDIGQNVLKILFGEDKRHIRQVGLTIGSLSLQGDKHASKSHKIRVSQVNS